MASFSDTFNRADGALGSNWATVASASPFEILGNIARFATPPTTTTASAVATSAATFAANQEATVTLSGSTPFDKAGPAVRVNAATGTGYAVAMNAGTNAGAIVLFDSSFGSLSLGFGAFTVAVGDVVKLRVEGSTLSAWVNGALVSSGTDSAYSSGQPGMWGEWGNIRGTTLDNFIADDLATVLSPDATVSNANWSAVGAASLHAALATGDSDYITASTAGAVAEIGLSNPAVPLTLTDVSFTVRARLT